MSTEPDEYKEWRDMTDCPKCGRFMGHGHVCSTDKQQKNTCSLPWSPEEFKAMREAHNKPINPPYDPPGLKFYDFSSGRLMKYVDPDWKPDGATLSSYAGWLLYMHTDGQWATLRKATPEDVTKLEMSAELNYHPQGKSAAHCAAAQPPGEQAREAAANRIFDIAFPCLRWDTAPVHLRQHARELARAALAASPSPAPTDERLRKALEDLVDAVTEEVNGKGAGGYLLARLSDARAALAASPSAPTEERLREALAEAWENAGISLKSELCDLYPELHEAIERLLAGTEPEKESK